MNRIVLICFFIYLCCSMQAQNPYWEVAPTPYGGTFTLFPTNSNKAYALRIEDSLSFRSDDYGEHWAPMHINSVNPQLFGGITGGDLYIGRSGTFYSNIRKKTGGTWIRELSSSSDEGNSWNLLTDQMNLQQIFETPAGTLIGSDPSFRLYRSSDGGYTWLNVSDLGINILESQLDIVCDNQNRMILTDGNSQLLYSTDDGQTWNIGGNLSATNANFLFLTHAGAVLRIKAPGILYRSNNWGLLWTAVNVPLAYDEAMLSVTTLAGGRMILATTRHLFYSDDDGISWNVLSTSGDKISYMLTTTPLPNGDLIGQGKGAAYRSSDGGHTWTFSSYGMQLAYVSQLAFLTDSFQMAVTPDGLWKTENGGQSWIRLLADTSAVDYSTAPQKHSLAIWNQDSFAIGFGKKAWRTFDGGQSFEQITPPDGMHDNCLFAGDGGVLFANDTLGVSFSNDFGFSWQSILPVQYLIKMCRHPNGSLIVVTEAILYNNKSIYISTDEGATWQTLSLPYIHVPRLHDMFITPDGDIYVTGIHASSQQNGILRSSDLGETWHKEPIPFPYSQGPLASNAFKHLFTTAYPGVTAFTSVDAGRSWYSLPAFDQYLSGLLGLEISPSGHLYAVSFHHPVYRSIQSSLNGGYIRGSVRLDADADCSTPDAQALLKNWIVEINGERNFTVNTSESGSYAVFTDPGAYEVNAVSPQLLWWDICNNPLTAQVDSAGITDSLDLVGVAVSECPLISVDVSIPQLRRCFNNSIYVAYCNIGSEKADSAWIDIELDPYLSLESSAQAFEVFPNNTYRFQLGDVEVGDCGQFSFVAYVNCDATVLGQTHCVSAHAFPDTLCTDVVGWSGATIVAHATCQDSVVRLELENVSDVPSSLLDYIIIEDDVVLLHQQKQYDPGGSFHLEYPANGHTWRIESEQEPGHPFSNLALAFVEGCGGYQSLGYINQFNINGWMPSVNKECVGNSGSYDPNDKSGFPTGYSDAHRIRPGQALEYMIRFQNTGTDTAFTVEIRDTLSAWLDPASVRPGASSHGYTWHLSGNGILTFRFDNIMLPDSNVNLAGSQGFVNFRIDQKPDVPLETQILNTAAIYFDFNEPVITNQTLHTVGLDYLTSIDEITSDLPTIVVQPNPAVQETTVHLPPGVERLRVFDVTGKMQRIFQTHSAPFRLERTNLPSGIYLLQAEGKNGKVLGVGKVLWR